MIVEWGGVIGLRRGETIASIPGYELALRGVAYLPGAQPGPAAVAAALSNAGPDPMLEAARRLRGNFFLSIRDVANGRTVAFTDSGWDVRRVHERGPCRDILPAAGGGHRGEARRYGPGRVVEFSILARSTRAGPCSPRSGVFFQARSTSCAMAILPHPRPRDARDRRSTRSRVHAGALLPGARLLPHWVEVSVDLTGGSGERLVATLLARVCRSNARSRARPLERRGDRREGCACPWTSASCDHSRCFRRGRSGGRSV